MRYTYHIINITQDSTDVGIIQEIGARARRHRLNRNQTQATLAQFAGVTRDTVARFESGKSITFSNLIKILRSLGMLSNLDILIPEPQPSPIQLSDRGSSRQRAREARSL